MAEDTPEQLLDRVHRGDERAVEELLDRYVSRLIGLARSRLPSKLARRLDPEDVVQSACRSFFRRARAGLYELGEDEELWHLLATITVNKARKAVTRHTARKRTVESEQSTPRDPRLATLSPEALAHDPSPEQAAILIEETERLMSDVSPLQRQILQLRLQGYAIAETAEQANCSQRTVHRAIERARSVLEKRLLRDAAKMRPQKE